MPKQTKLRVTAAQIDCLCTFFEENPEVITGYKKTPSCVKAVQMKWKKITPHLNSLGMSKNQRGWAKYLCDLKAKLKKKRIKWRQNCDGNGPIICNADDFSEISLRMLQVLNKEVTKLRDSKNSNASESEHTEYNVINVKNEQNECIKVLKQNESNKSNDTSGTKLNEKSETPHVFLNSNDMGDEFDMFGRNMAQQLKALPLAVALETQELLLSIMCKQRLKNLKDVMDPLDKQNC